MTHFASALQRARVSALESRRWTYTHHHGWHRFERRWHGTPEALADNDLDRLLERVEARQAAIESELDALKSNRTPAIPVSTGLRAG